MQLISLLVLGATGASALPSSHAHMHRAFHQRRDAEKRDVMVTATINGKVVSWDQGGSPFVKASHPATTAVPAATPAAAPATDNAGAAPAAPAADGVGSGSSGAGAGSAGGSSAYVPFASCSANQKRATAADIASVGNTGCAGYGSNFKLIEASLIQQYSYTINVIGGSGPMACAIWNKIGKNGGVNGFFVNQGSIPFNLPAGGSQAIAIDDNSQGALTCCPGNTIETSSFGMYMCPWTEFDFGSHRNGGNAGYDASQLSAADGGGALYPLKVTMADGSQPSVLYAGGSGTNAYTKGMNADDGVGGHPPANTPVHLIADYS